MVMYDIFYKGRYISSRQYGCGKCLCLALIGNVWKYKWPKLFAI